MQDSIYYDYNSLNSLIVQYSYAQITDYFGFTISKENSFYKCLTKNGLYYLVFMDSNSNTISFYDVSKGVSISKSELFFANCNTLDFASMKNAIAQFKVLNEFMFSQGKELDYIRTLFYGNTKRNSFADAYQTFTSLCEHPWFDKFVTYNKSSSMFSLPMFKNGNFNLGNFIDFNETSFKLRYNTNFSMFYSFPTMESYVEIDKSEIDLYNINSIRENQLIVSFNPLLLIESSSFFRVNQINYFPVILEPSFNNFKFLQLVSLLKPLKFEKVTILYSNEKEFYQNDLLNTSLFLIFSANLIQKEFYFEYNLSPDGKFSLIITRSQKEFNMAKLDDFFDYLCEGLYNGYSGRKTIGFTDDVVQRNLNFLSMNGFSIEYSKIEKNFIYYITFPFKIQTVIIFCDWMISRFLKNYNLMHVSGSTLFSDNPF